MEGLGIGMYVTRLDRPWVETTFPPGGFKVQTQADIDLIRKTSHYVFVDTTKGASPNHYYWILEDEQLSISTPTERVRSAPKSENEFKKLKQCFYEITTDLELELETAKEVKERIAKNTKRILNDLQVGKSLDIESVRDGVTAIVDSIIRNPGAFSLLSQMRTRGSYSYSHALGVSVWCAQFGRHLGLERRDINSLALGGMLLDVGKMKIPPEILNKREGFTRDDLEVIRGHVDHSVRIVAKTGGVPPEVLRMVATHHERADGSGYPEGLMNQDIPIFGRIAGIVDSYDAMTTARPYNPTIFTPHDAINELYHCGGDLFQTELIEQFIQTVGLYPTGSLVEFDTGQVGVVVAINDLKRLYPTVMLLLDENKQPLENFETVDLSAGDAPELKVVNGLAHGAYGINMDELFL